VAVNLSPRSLLDPQLPDLVGGLLERWEVPPRFLTMELTESFVMSDSGRSLGVLAGLSEVGVMLSIDDFGTGYSSLSYLKRLPIGEIKIDRSFVMNMQQDANDAMIVRATVDLGRNLGLRVVAEGVEDRETFEQLEELHCDIAQGYYLSKAIPSQEILRWMALRELDRSGAAQVEAPEAPTAHAEEPEHSHLRAI
jgi:EAL domain-containing protein (putative c-di-GMP-specific phosphodiesterase class I)